MDFLISFVRFLASPAVAAIDVLGPLLARASGQPYVSQHATAAGFAISAAVIALVAILLSSFMHARMKALRVTVRDERARHGVERQFLELLLNNGMQGTVIMKSDSQERTFLGNGRLLFEMLLDSAEAAAEGSPAVTRRTSPRSAMVEPRFKTRAASSSHCCSPARKFPVRTNAGSTPVRVPAARRVCSPV